MAVILKGTITVNHFEIMLPCTLLNGRPACRNLRMISFKMKIDGKQYILRHTSIGIFNYFDVLKTYYQNMAQKLRDTLYIHYS